MPCPIHIVIGQSGAGKTTFVQRTFVTPQKAWSVSTMYPVAVSMVDGVAFLGKYTGAIRTKGTDTLPYNAIQKILDTVDALEASSVRAIVVEGDRINNARFFDHVFRKGYDAHLYLVEAPLETSMARLARAGSKITLTFVKATRTKSATMFALYGKFMHGRKVKGG